MKTISLNESQFSRIFESILDSDFGEDSIPERIGLDKVGVQATITNADGDVKKSKPIRTDDFADTQSPQQWGSVGGRKSSNTI